MKYAVIKKTVVRVAHYDSKEEAEKRAECERKRAILIGDWGTYDVEEIL